jgi:hypothetical protein
MPTWTDVGGFWVSVGGFALAIVLAAVGWYQARAARGDARVAQEHADAATRTADEAQRQSAAAEKSAEAAAAQARSAREALDLEREAKPVVRATQRTDNSTTWWVVNLGRGWATQVNVYLKFDPTQREFGYFQLGDIEPGARKEMKPTKAFPMLSDLVGRGPGHSRIGTNEVVIEWTVPGGPRRSVTTTPVYD